MDMTILDLGLNMFVGVVTGVVTAILIFATKRFFDTTIHPFLERTRYNGIKISGPWYGIDDNDIDQIQNELTLMLEQSAHRVTGTFRIQHASQTNNFDLHFNVTGTIWEGYVTLAMTPADRTIGSSAAGLVKIAGGGGALVGLLANRNVNKEEVGHIDLILGRGPRHVIRPQLLKAEAERLAARREKEEQAKQIEDGPE